MTLTDISNIRLINQQVSFPKFKTVKEVVGWMGAIQAQDFAMAKWAIGTRLSNFTIDEIDTAIDRGEIIRTHLLRPTWHIVSADDIYWLLELTAPKIKALLKTRHIGLDLTESVIAKTNKLFQDALKGGNHLTREELVVILEKAKIANYNNKFAHILMIAELDCIICSGSSRGNKQTYALLNERVPNPKSISPEESLEKLARTYFTSRGPVTLQDFVWWSGLRVNDARSALEMIKSDFVSEKIGSESYWISNSLTHQKSDDSSTYLLPAFDEFIISYKDRSASIPLEKLHKTISNNGIFWPIIVCNGQVIGIWKREIKKEKVILETNFFKPQSKSVKELIEKEAIHFGNFLGKKVEVKHKID